MTEKEQARGTLQEVSDVNRPHRRRGRDLLPSRPGYLSVVELARPTIRNVTSGTSSPRDKEQDNENRNIIGKNSKCREQDQQETAYYTQKAGAYRQKRQTPFLMTKYITNSDSPEARTLKWDIEHYTDDISRLEREIAETTLALDNYRKQLTGLMERVSVLITDMPDILRKLSLIIRLDDLRVLYYRLSDLDSKEATPVEVNQASKKLISDINAFLPHWNDLYFPNNAQDAEIDDYDVFIEDQRRIFWSRQKR